MTDIHIDYEALSLSPLLVGLRMEELQDLMSPAKPRSYGPGEVVVSEGSPGDTMFMVCSGEFIVEKGAASGEQIELAVMNEPGEFFGEMVFVDVLPRSATIRAQKDGVLLALELETLREFFSTHQDAHLNITLNIARMLSVRLRKADETIAELKSSG